MKKEIKLEEYLGTTKVSSDFVLSIPNWDRLLSSDDRIMEYLNKWKDFQLKVRMYSIIHGDSASRSPSEIGYKNYFYDSVINMYKSYELKIERNLTFEERKKYSNLSKNIGINIDLPLSMWVTVLRADLQRRNKSGEYNEYLRLKEKYEKR